MRCTVKDARARVFVDALERLNYCMEPLLADAGIRRADLHDPDARIPCAVWGPTFGRALKQRPMKNAGSVIRSLPPSIEHSSDGVMKRHGPSLRVQGTLNAADHCADMRQLDKGTVILYRFCQGGSTW